MLVEHVLRANGATAGRLSFATKANQARSRPSQLPRPLDACPALWDRLARLYNDLEEARHAITHRRANAVGRDLQIYDEQRRLIDTVTESDIAAFAGALHGLAELVIEGSDDQRRVGMVAWHLNQLTARHGMPRLPATDPQAGRRLLKADLVALGDGRVQLDVADARKAVNSQPGPSLWDLELYTGASVFVGRWEDLPDPSAATYEFELASPPDWLTEEVAAS
jgi:hypothetical protein